MDFLTLWNTWQSAHPVYTFLIFEFAGVMGMIVHFLKLDIKGQTASDIKAYFTNNLKYTLWALIVTLFVSGGALALNQGIMAAFLAGYTFDSALNK